jgi:AraC-like DNA-binding protein
VAQSQSHALPDVQLGFHLHAMHGRTVEPGWRYPEHDHPLFELNVVLSGEQVTTFAGGETFIQQEWDVLLIKPGVVHQSRESQGEEMTYYCLHLDADDPVLHRLLMQQTASFYASRTELAQRLRPLVERLAALSSGESSGGRDEQQLAVRVAGLHIVLALCENSLPERSAVEAAPEDAAVSDAASKAALRSMREQVALERRIRDLLVEAGTGKHAGNALAPLLPPHRWIALFTLNVDDNRFWAKPERFGAKMMITEAVKPIRHYAIVEGDHWLTVVLLSNDFAVPPIESHAASLRNALEAHFGMPVKLGFGGIAKDAADMRAMYRKSLSLVGVQAGEALPIGRSEAEFVNRTIRLALGFMEEAYANPSLSLSSLADMLEVTPNYLSALFKSETGFTFTQHMQRIRNEHAKQLLRTTTLKVYEVSRQVGYIDHAYFSRLFKSTNGMKPNEYRLTVDASNKS